MAVMAKFCPGVRVCVVDLSQPRVDAWNSSKLPIYEPGLQSIVEHARGKNLFFSTEVEKEIEAADMVFISVDTPTKTHGVGSGSASNVKNLEAVARTIARCASSSTIVVEKSTVPVQTADALQKILAANSLDRPDVEFQVLSNPEFLAEGTAVRDLLSPSRVLIGGPESEAGEAAIAKLVALYAQWVPREKILTTNVWSSELSKLVANAYLAQRISSINSIAMLCEATKANVDEVSRAVGADTRIGPHFLRASVGFGGSCFRKDVLNLVYLSESFGLPEVAQYWRQVVTMNEWQKERFARRMINVMFNTVTGKKITFFGFAFKKDTGDVRETAAAYVAKYLLDERATISIYDPQVQTEDLWREFASTLGITEESHPNLKKVVTLENDPYEAARDSHAIAVMTEWDEFKDYDYEKLFHSMQKPAFIFDGRNILDHQRCFELGFEVACIGKTLPSHFDQPSTQPSAAAGAKHKRKRQAA
jgi:UDPglucose 6-dehydrogenase